jgi:hypothetical protein
MILYTLHYIEGGEIIQSGEVLSRDSFPEVPDGATITEGFAAIRGEEKVIAGTRVSYVREREPEELLAAIERERTRRLSAGFDFDFGDARGVHRIGTTAADERGWDKVTKLAAAYLAIGNPEAPIVIVTETGSVVITAIEWQSILVAAGAFQQPIYMSSFALGAMNPMPQDVENPAHWS